jgi:hypothetical protein
LAKPESIARKYDLEVGHPKDLGIFQHAVLLAVSDGRYEDALVTLADYQKRKSAYPTYAKKTERLFEHSQELVSAIKAKKTFPNLTSLAQSKQEEIHQKARENWEDLKASLRRIKSIEADLALQDARSSIWVIRALLISMMIFLGAFVINEAFRSFGRSLPLVLNDIVKMVTSEIFDP